MAAKTKPARVIQFAEIEQRFELVPLRITHPPHPAVSKRREGGYAIRVLKGETRSGTRATTTVDYFYLDAEGTIVEAPRGYARDYRPGRVPVEELDAAVARWFEAVSR